MGDMTKNFSRKEFACKCGCGLDDVNPLLPKLLQQIRDHFDKPIRIVSGLRCELRNKKVGGAKKSQHLYGNAADIQVKDFPPHVVAAYANSIMTGWGGIKAYPTFTHVDVRQNIWRG